MSEPVGSLEAGTVDIPVKSDTTGFGRELQAKLEKETRNVVARIGVALRDASLRDDLEEKVERESRGVSAEIEVKVKKKSLRKRLEAAVKEASAKVAADINVHVDSATLRDRLETAVSAAAAGVNAHVGVELDSGGLRKKVTAAAKAASVGQKVHVGVDVDADAVRTTLAQRIRAASQGLVASVRGLFSRGSGARGAGGGFAPSVGVPDAGVSPIGGGGGGGPGIASGLASISAAPLSRFAMLAVKLTAMLSLIGPLIATITAGVGGLAVMVANLAVSVNTIAALPGILYGVVGVFAAGMIAFNGFAAAVAGAEGAMDGLPPSMRAAAVEARVFKQQWADLKATIQENFWAQLKGRIAPFANVVMPRLQNVMAGFAQSLGKTAAGFAEWMSTDEWGTEFESVMGSSVNLMDSLGGSALNLAKWLGDIAVAAQPLVARFGALVAKWSEAAAGMFDTDEEKSGLADRLSYAADKGAQLGRILRETWGIISGVFNAGRGTGDSLLGALEEKLTGVSDWVNSSEGAQKVSEWFEAIEPLARELGGLLGDVGKSLLDMSTNASLTDLVKQVREDLLPHLTEFLDKLGESLGPEVIDLMSQLLDLMTNLADQGSPLTRVFSAINGALDGINTFLENNPDAADKISQIAGALLAFGLLRPLLAKTGVFSLLGGALSGLGSGLGGLFSRGGRGGGVGGASGVGGAAAGAAAGAGRLGVLGKMFSQSVYWTTAMPVYVVNGGLGGGSGSSGGSAAKSKGLRGRNMYATRGRGLAGLLGGAASWLTRGRIGSTWGQAGARAAGASQLGRLGLPAVGAAGATTVPTLVRGSGLGGLLAGGAGSGVAGTAARTGLGRLVGGAAGPLALIGSLLGSAAGDMVQDGNGGLRDLGGGALSGAATGAGIGMLGGPWGALAGALIGGTIGAVKSGADWNQVGSEWSDLWVKMQASAKTGVSIIGTNLGALTTSVPAMMNTAAAGIANALPPSLQTVGQQIGLFKVDTEGRVAGIDLAGAFSGAVSALRSGASTLLYGAGSTIISGLRAGMESAYNTVRTSLGTLTNNIVSWKGPPERDAVLLQPAGTSVIRGFLNGLEAQYGSVRSSLGSFTDSLTGYAPAASSFGAATAGVDAVPYGDEASGVTFAPGAVTIHNPVPETASTSLAKQVRRAGEFKFGGV